jgi:DNA-binding response OmpR family regulator
MPETVLVVEDDPSILRGLQMNLGLEGFKTICAHDGEEGLAMMRSHKPDLVLLDLMLPKLGGLDVIRQLRADDPDTPIIVLSAKDQEGDKVLALSLGADDYVTKPFSPRELVARVRAILRRVDGPASPRPEVRSIGAVEVDAGRREARVGGRVVVLAAREFDLLQFLAANLGLALTRQQLLDGVWGPGWYGDERTVDVHVRQLRRKLGDALPLTTVWGVGYRLG